MLCLDLHDVALELAQDDSELIEIHLRLLQVVSSLLSCCAPVRARH